MMSDGGKVAQSPAISRKSPPPPDVIELARMEDRISFAYFERCVIGQEDNAITVADAEGVVRLPSASLGVLMLGPGSSVSHKAMSTIAESGATVVWVGENGVRMYAAARPLTHSSALLQQQAKLVSNTRSRLAVARAMYQMRFPHEDVSKLTMQQLRGREGLEFGRFIVQCQRRLAWSGISARMIMTTMKAVQRSTRRYPRHMHACMELSMR